MYVLLFYQVCNFLFKRQTFGSMFLQSLVLDLEVVHFFVQFLLVINLKEFRYLKKMCHASLCFDHELSYYNRRTQKQPKMFPTRHFNILN